MLHQSFGIETIDIPFKPARIIACTSIEVPPFPASRRAPWLGTRLGFIGSAEGFDLLRFEAPTLALSPRTAPALLAAGRIDALVVECAPDDLLQEWGHAFLDWVGADGPARDLMHQAAGAGVPRIALLRGGAGKVPLFAPLAAEADHVVVTESSARDALCARGIATDLVPPAIQPSLHHGFVTKRKDASASPKIVSLDLVRAIDEPEVTTFLESITSFGLRLCSADKVVRQQDVDKMPPALIEACLGTISADQLRHIFVTSDLLVQIARSDRDPGADVQHALHAAANRCAVVILGYIPDDDCRRGFARVFTDPRDLRLFISRFTMDPVRAHAHMRATWRKVHRDHSADNLALRLARCADPQAAGTARPRATIVTPTFRPQRLRQVLETFRAQTWSDRELVVVANTDRPEEWDTGLLRPDAGESIAFLSRQFGPGPALNIGGARGTGDYVLRMDDDDRYGRHYVEDMMLGAAALRPDMMGLKDCFYLYPDENRLVWDPRGLKRPDFYSSAEISSGGHIAGFSHTVRRSLLSRTSYPDNRHVGVDVAFLDALIDKGDLLCARIDGLNAVVERRRDVRSHTWRTAPTSDDQRFRELDMSLEELLNEDRLASYPRR